MNISSSSQIAGSKRAGRQHQTGVVLIFALIALTIMLIGAVALVSSFNTSLVATGNLAFKRDLQNQAERVVASVITTFSATGALADGAARANSLAAQNYSAVALATNAQGIPTALLSKDDATFNAAGFSASKDIDAGNSVKIRYVVDRLCRGAPSSTAGKVAQALDLEDCVPCSDSGAALGDSSHLQGDNAGLANVYRGIAGGIPIPVSYRITARVSGPRDTQAYIQTTFCEPLPAS